MDSKLKPKAVLFNGPPRSGKDEMCNQLVKHAEFTGHERGKYSFGRFPKDGAHASFGLTVKYDHYENCKDVPSEDFQGITPRQAYINHSESYMKPLYGKDIYGRLMRNLILKRLDRMTIRKRAPLFFFSDCGFVEELEQLREVFGDENMLLVRMHRSGSDYKKYGDSRSYVDNIGKVRSIDLHNNFSIDHAVENALSVVKNSFLL